MESIGVKIGENIYIDLESIFDVRFTVLEKYFNNIKYKGLSPIDMIKKDPVLYYGRLTYGLPNIPSAYFKHVYDDLVLRRNLLKDLIKMSKLTNIVNLINAETVLLESKRLEENEVKVNLVVNTHPYEFTEKEKETLKFILSTTTIILKDNINIVNENNTVLINNLKMGKYDTLFMYRGLEWLMINTILHKLSMPEVKMYIPAIFDSANIDVTKPEQLEQIFNSYREIFEPIINLTFLPHEMFSLSPVLLEKIKTTQ